MEKKKILFCGVSLSKFSGLGYVISNFMKRFQDDGFDIAYATLLGNDTELEKIPEWNKDFGEKLNEITVYNCQMAEEKKFFQFDNVVNDYSPDIVISCLDPWQLDQIEKCAYRESFFWLCYLTVETPKYPKYIMFPTPYHNVPRKDITHILNNANLVVPVSQMGKKALEDLEIEVYEDNVYNGIDFSKLPDRKYLKKEIFGGVVEEDDFIFMSMGKNMERKKFDLIIKSFKLFLDKMGNNIKYKLYLHTDIDSVGGGGTDLYQLIVDLKLEPHILLPMSFKQQKTMSTENLYKRYSVCDCYVCLSSGEGFNYGTAESMANKLPVVYIDYGAHAEYLKDIGLPVKVKTTYSAANAQMEWAVADIEHCAKQMARAVSDPKWRDKAEERGYTFAKENFGWDDIFNKLKKALMDNFSKFKRSGIFDFKIKRVV